MDKAIRISSETIKFVGSKDNFESSSYTNNFYLTVRGYVEMLKGNTIFACNDFANCILKDPLYSRTHFHLAELFERNANKDSDLLIDATFQYLKVMNVLSQTTAHLPIFKLTLNKLKTLIEDRKIIKIKFIDRNIYWDKNKDVLKKIRIKA
ncbi:MAG: hypothetical protein ABIE07_02890 [Candidatus Zixiibacteriota bacterium]